MHTYTTTLYNRLITWAKHDITAVTLRAVAFFHRNYCAAARNLIGVTKHAVAGAHLQPQHDVLAVVILHEASQSHDPIRSSKDHQA